MNFAMNKKEDFSPIKQTLDPIYVGSSVIGIKFDKGIIIACDVRLNYGHLCKHMDVEGRLLRLTERTIFGYSGEYSDPDRFQDRRKLPPQGGSAHRSIRFGSPTSTGCAPSFEDAAVDG